MDQYYSLQKYFSYFVKRTPDTLWQLWNDGMACSGIGMPLSFRWYGMKWHGIGMRGIWYGISIPWYHGIGMEPIYHIGMGYPQGSLIQRIGWPHRSPKLGDWSAMCWCNKASYCTICRHMLISCTILLHICPVNIPNHKLNCNKDVYKGPNERYKQLIQCFILMCLENIKCELSPIIYSLGKLPLLPSVSMQ